jgi:uncharacterized RmlC-like cupin family protein
MTRVRVTDSAAVEPGQIVPGAASRQLFAAGAATMVVTTYEADVADPWHVLGLDVFAYITAGAARVEYGPDGESTAAFEAGEFVHVPAGTVRRTVTDRGVEFVAVLHGDGDVEEADGPPDRPPDRAPRVVGPGALVAADSSPGVTRETPFPGEDVCLQRVRSPRGTTTDWHHHGDNVALGYVREGCRRTEHADGVVEATTGECVIVPPGLVHREASRMDLPYEGVVWLCGGEPWLVDADAPRD